MALRQLPSAPFLQAFLPIAYASFRPAVTIPALRMIRQPLLPALSFTLPIASLTALPSIFSDLWESILRAVPKKKTSHMKKRHRQMAGKALKDVTALNKCSGCGRVKRAHVLCPYCVQSIKAWFGNGMKSQKELDAEKEPKKMATKEAIEVQEKAEV
ncbi:hypothetical protein BJ546DRAFT_971225 [Cryomyces antarcticus]